MEEKRQLYDEIKIRLQKIDFHQIWSGFHEYPFALYDSREIYLNGNVIPWNQHFIGCTTIRYEGVQIAIWDLDTPTVSDYDVLTSMLVHEMFHAFQMEQGEERFPQDLVTLRYPCTNENQVLKYQETKALIKAARAEQAQQKRTCLADFCRLRNKRYESLLEYARCEGMTETAEGMAEYAGMSALEMLSTLKFLQKKEEYLTLLERQIALYFDIRRISYYTGAILMLTAKDAEINLSHSLKNCQMTTFELLANQIITNQIPETDAAYQVSEKERKQIDAALKELTAEKKAKIEQFQVSAGQEWVNQEYVITGYDPMNMIRYEDYVLSTHFIQLTVARGQEKLTLLQHVLLKMHPDSPNQGAGYLMK